METCESRQRDITILDSNNKYSHGWLQFQTASFNYFGKKFGLGHSNIHSRTQQETLARAMLDAGLSSNWKTCFKITTNIYGAYPLDE